MAVSNNSLFDAATALFVNDIIDESEFVALPKSRDAAAVHDQR
jgi:hypothetical protein